MYLLNKLVYKLIRSMLHGLVIIIVKVSKNVIYEGVLIIFSFLNSDRRSCQYIHD